MAVSSPELRSLVASAISLRRWRGPDHRETRAARLAVERRRLAEQAERVAAAEREAARP